MAVGNLAVDGLVFLNMNNGVIVGGTNVLTLGAGGVDMVAANHSVTLSCPVNIGLAQTWNIGPNSPGDTLNADGPISGSATLSKGGYGTVILNGTNSFSGTLNVGTGSTSASDGCLRVANPAAITGAASPINIPNNNGGSSTLQLDGTAGSITIAQGISLSGRNTNVVAIENDTGNNTIAGSLNLAVGGGNYWIQSDGGTLTFSGAVPGSTPGGSRTLSFMGSGNISITGPLQDGAGGGTVNVVKSGAGTLILASLANSLTGSLTISNGTVQVGNGTADGTLGAAMVTNYATLLLNPVGAVTIANAITGPGSLTKNNSGSVTLSGAGSFTGPTRVIAGTLLVNGSLGAGMVTVAGGTLGGNGVIGGPVTVQPGATLAPGNSTGLLTINNSLTLNGTTFIEINKSVPTNDVVRGMNIVNYDGTLTVTNLGGTLIPGDSFKIFYATNYSGSFAAFNLPALNASLAWNTTNLAVNGTLSVIAAVPPRFNSIAQQGDGSFLFAGTGAASQDYELEAATNLNAPVFWQFFASTNADTNGHFQFVDLQATNFHQRFYRISQTQ